MTRRKLRIGDRVQVPWGSGLVPGEVLEIWGDPPHHVRVALELGGSDASEDIVPLLLSPHMLQLEETA